MPPVVPVQKEIQQSCDAGMRCVLGIGSCLDIRLCWAVFATGSGIVVQGVQGLLLRSTSGCGS
jgi:hypothetical protein